MPETLRTFIAVKIEPQTPLIELFNHFKNEFDGEKIRWVQPGNLHLTLRFLGDTTPGQFEQVKSGLEEVARDFNPFEFSLKGTGFFKRNRQPKVLFVKIEEAELLKQLATRIEEKVVAIGFEEERGVNPHLTLGRIKFLRNKARFYKTIDSFSEKYIQKVKINEIIYYQSILKSHGPEYKSIIKVGLDTF